MVTVHPANSGTPLFNELVLGCSLARSCDRCFKADDREQLNILIVSRCVFGEHIVPKKRDDQRSESRVENERTTAKRNVQNAFQALAVGREGDRRGLSS
jgi:hypothetical protein